MPIEFNCESCSKLLRVPDGSGGKQCLCPGCSQILNIPSPQVDEPRNEELPNDNSQNTGSQNNGADIALCIPCPKCKHELICDPSLIGTKGQCRNCKHIFVISDLPTNESHSSEQTVNWVFSCPKCDQLFEGNESMRDKLGKCHACGEVFSIALRVANEATVKKPEERQHRAPSTSSSRLNSFDDDLTLDVHPQEQKSEHKSEHKSERKSVPEPSSKPQKQSDSSKAVFKDSRAVLPPIQFNCTSCRGRMEVPGEAAQQLTHCPHCKRQLTIPSESEPTPDALPANDPWADLGALVSAPTPMPQSNPFGDTMYPAPMSPMTYSANRRGNDPTQHIVCGIFIALFAFIGIAVEIFQIVINVIIMIAAASTDARTSGAAFWLTAVWTFLLILSSAQLVGGIALARRSGINTARTGVIICCIPCFCLINIAFGIWGCVLVFGNNAERDFR